MTSGRARRLEDVVDCLMGIVANDSITGHVAVVDRGEMLG
jgi:hypothetical protein